MLVSGNLLALLASTALTVVASPASFGNAALEARSHDSVAQLGQGVLPRIEQVHQPRRLHGQEKRASTKKATSTKAAAATAAKTTAKTTTKTTAQTTLQTTLKTSSIKATTTSSAAASSQTSLQSSAASSAATSAISAVSSSASQSAASSTVSGSSTLSGSSTSSSASSTSTGDITKFCGASYSTKRGLGESDEYGLVARDPTAKGPVTQPVAVGSQGSEKAPLGLFSTRFGTCMGVAVVGTGSGKTRFMIHLTATTGWKSLFATFASDVNAASLSNMKVVLRTPDLTKDLPTSDNRSGMPTGLPVWVNDDTVASQKMIDDLKAEIKSALKVDAQVKSGPMGAMFRNEGDAGSMEVSGMSDPADIYVDGVVV